jgi:hypothetical protein
MQIARELCIIIRKRREKPQATFHKNEYLGGVFAYIY